MSKDPVIYRISRVNVFTLFLWGMLFGVLLMRLMSNLGGLLAESGS